MGIIATMQFCISIECGPSERTSSVSLVYGIQEYRACVPQHNTKLLHLPVETA